MSTAEKALSPASQAMKDAALQRKSGGSGSSHANRLREAQLSTSTSYAGTFAPPVEAEKVLEGEVITAIDPVLIDPNPYQNRRDFDGVEELSRSIDENGQNQPIGVRRKGSRYQIIFGERRWRAIQLLPNRKIDVVIREMSDLEMVYICSSENSNRKKPYDYERWLTVHQLVQMDQTMENICKRMVIKRDVYYKLLKYGELHPEIRAFLEVKPKALQINEASELEKIFKDLNPEHDPDEVCKFALGLMQNYLDGKLKNRGEIIKQVKAKYVVAKPRNREKVNTEIDLKLGDTVVGQIIKTPTEFRISITKSECEQDKIEKLEELIKEFFKS